MKTIYSLVTKPINQNVAIIRISGNEAFEVIKRLIPGYKPVGNKVEFRKIFINDKFIDDVLVLSFKKPNSFTGENVIEIQSHGSMFIVSKIISFLNGLGIEQSTPGEFTKQAFMNGKIDLSQSEAINSIVLSDSSYLTDLSRKNLNKKQSNFINKSLRVLGNFISRVQVSIDYPENTDLPKYNLKVMAQEIKKFQAEIEKIIFDSSRLIRLSKGILISLIGIPNSGKSTLLNALLNEERAIISDIEGTTRDIVESQIYLNGVKITLQDTAGIREDSNNSIEQEGIRRSINSIKNADIVLFLLDGTKNLKQQRELAKNLLKNNSHKLIEVITKSDLQKNKGINISAKNNEINALLEKIESYIGDNIFNSTKNDNILLITENQINIFNEINDSLLLSLEIIGSEQTADILALELENCMKELGKIIGITIDQDYLTNLFSSFCIGK